MPSVTITTPAAHSFDAPLAACKTAAGPCGADQFAFARINGEICLVQVPLTAAPMPSVEVKYFRHELVTIFRFSHSATHATEDIRILEPIDARHTRYEEENGMLFLSRNVMDRLRKMTEMRERSTRRTSQLRRWSPSH